jgi:hypothetical protein
MEKTQITRKGNAKSSCMTHIAENLLNVFSGIPGLLFLSALYSGAECDCSSFIAGSSGNQQQS